VFSSIFKFVKNYKKCELCHLINNNLRTGAGSQLFLAKNWEQSHSSGSPRLHKNVSLCCGLVCLLTILFLTYTNATPFLENGLEKIFGKILNVLFPRTHRWSH